MVLDNTRGNAPLDTWASDIYSGTRSELEAILLYWRDAKGALLLHYTRQVVRPDMDFTTHSRQVDDRDSNRSIVSSAQFISDLAYDI